MYASSTKRVNHLVMGLNVHCDLQETKFKWGLHKNSYYNTTFGAKGLCRWSR